MRLLAKEEADSTDLHQKLHSLGALVVNDYLLAEGVVVNNVAKPGSRASWLMRLSGGLIVSQAAIKTGFGPWVKYPKTCAHYAIISQTSSAIRCLGTNTHARAQLESVRAGLGWLWHTCRPVRVPFALFGAARPW